MRPCVPLCESDGAHGFQLYKIGSNGAVPCSELYPEPVSRGFSDVHQFITCLCFDKCEKRRKKSESEDRPTSYK